MTAEVIEQTRQRAVDALEAVDTPAEERFDRITRLACQVFDVPISTVTLIDRDRAFFKSCAGLDIVEAPRDTTFCGRTVELNEVVVVQDASADEYYRRLPGVAGEPHIRFYAGIPIRDAYGSAVGTFCLYDTRVRDLDEHGLRVLSELAAWAQQELLDSTEMDRARVVQRALLPRVAPSIPGYETSAICVPASVVAGDFYDHQDLDGLHTFTVADVMGKGAAAAILMATVRAVIRSESRAYATGRLGPDADLGDLMTEVNTILMADLAGSSSFVTGFFGCADPASGSLRYVDAGHGMTIVVRADGSHEHLATTDLPLGVSTDWRWTERSLDLRPGDQLLCFSDGLFDLLGGTMESIAAIADLVHAHPRPDDLMRHIGRLASGTTPFDDVTALAVLRTGTAS
jgi:serine phosphatase RsbU (regulator of sigma subunit)